MNHVIRVYGIVQGVGFRPFVSRIADAAGIVGSVANKGSYVEIFAGGTKEQMDQFLHDLTAKAPERSSILKVDVRDTDPINAKEFLIIESEKEAGAIFVSPDIATCDKCKQELYDPNNRRYMHPFINCTACGPRVTILDAMPYDRERTSMGEFPMCPTCEWEYTHAETRRYDAQPVCCNDCGPEVYLVGRPERGRDAITATRRAIMEGQIVAIKGIGGFHLCCDANNEAAVARLRDKKHRPAKPFAVMMRDLDAVKRHCVVSPAQEEILDGHQKPIILLERKPESTLAPSVAPDNPKVGVMLPYAPVQMLLFDYNDDLTMPTDSFVMTSGNMSGAPICRDDVDAVNEISDFCDLILSHNRKIRLRCDDSVMDFYEDEPYMIRRSRGYAPLPVMMSEETKGQVLAIGGELKNTFCIGRDDLFYPSPYVGDMEDVRTVQALRESVVRLEELLETEHQIVACDMHPKYNTTAVAAEFGDHITYVQHHYAHVLSCMAENDLSSASRVLGVSFDGTGYGTDQSIWGGEFLLSDYDGFNRAASIAPFTQVGGDLSAKEGWRIAVSMLCSLYGDEKAMELCDQLDLGDPATRSVIARMRERKINAVTSTSAGRLFDAVSAILGVRQASTFEGEASTTLMFRAQAYEKRMKEAGTDPAGEIETIVKTHPELLNVQEYLNPDADPETEPGARLIMRTDALVKWICEEHLAGADTEKLAYFFHGILAYQIADLCGRILRTEEHLDGVTLTGGVYQNTLLLALTEMYLREMSVTVYRHRLIPPNDGGICLGQAVYAMRILNK
ncbi:MAG: carbamoyltransferase HypF [Lachnospiraceae bacterium]|nr:carbamoyltransferase HypF [Lachnospiraceae bacterium]